MYSDGLTAIRQSAQPSISRRQRDILGLLARGMTHRQVARSVGISERQLGREVAALMEALRARSHFELAINAERAGLFD